MKKLDFKKLFLIILGVIILAEGRWLKAQKEVKNQGFTNYISSVESLHTKESVADYSSFPQTDEENEIHLDKKYFSQNIKTVTPTGDNSLEEEELIIEKKWKKYMGADMEVKADSSSYYLGDTVTGTWKVSGVQSVNGMQLTVSHNGSIVADTR